MADLSKLRIEHEEEERSSNGWLKLLVVVAVILGIGGIGWYLYTGPLKPAIQVEVTTVTSVYPSQVNSVLTASGYVVAQRKADVASKATGRLEILLVEEGTIVKKGDVLGQLESRDVRAALDQAQADLELARADLWQAKVDMDRKKSLVDQALVSKSEYDIAEALYKRHVAAVDSAQARVRSNQIELENTFVRAPFNGTVLTKSKASSISYPHIPRAHLPIPNFLSPYPRSFIPLSPFFSTLILICSGFYKDLSSCLQEV